MNFKQFQQSELKRFDDWVFDIEMWVYFGGKLPCKSGDITAKVQDGKKEIKSFLLSSIEKAYALGKEKGYWNRKADDKMEKEMLKADEAHRTKEGWCCACGYDMAVLEEKIAKEKDKIKKEILEGLPKKCDGIIEVKEEYGSTVRASTQEEKLGFNTALDQIINLLKNK